MALVQCLKSQQISQRSYCCCHSFLLPKHSHSIIIDIVCHPFPNIHCRSKDDIVGDRACQFEITIVNRVVRIWKGDQLLLDPGRESLAPQQGFYFSFGGRNKINTIHSRTSSVTCTNRGRIGVRHQFNYSCWARGHITCQPPKILEEIVQWFWWIQPRTGWVLMEKCLLQQDEANLLLQDADLLYFWQRLQILHKK